MREVLEQIKKEVDSHDKVYDYVTRLLQIRNGHIHEQLLQELKDQMGSQQSYKYSKMRAAPLNLPKKIVDKLSPIYRPAPRRIIKEGTGSEIDGELLEFYEKSMNVNKRFLYACMMATLNQGALLAPYVDDEGKPRLQVLNKNQFCALSRSGVDWMKETDIVLFGKRDGEKIYRWFNKNKWIEFNDKCEVNLQAYAENESDGSNPFGVMPFVYLNLSESELFPVPEDDMLFMSLLIPVLFTDLNYASMFQAFSIIYTIDVEDGEFALAPNMKWNLKSDNTGEKNPQVGTIKPSVDVEQVLTLIQTQLATWLNTKGIRPGQMGTMDKDSFATGISKMIDEMDTQELRSFLIEYATDMEEKFWHLIMHKMHPVWVTQGLLGDEKRLFSADAEVEINFSEQLPMVSRGQIVRDLNEEVKAGFTTRRKAIKTLNPELTESEVDALITDIDSENHGSGSEIPPDQLDGKEDPKVANGVSDDKASKAEG